MSSNLLMLIPLTGGVLMHLSIFYVTRRLYPW